mmetsp:Transcript_26655/g.61318  ORF Transcript_26655/g.61318 Transcript_26655/m.61318 type:complete len:97 (-) Transcript_26655:173-463(-)
MRSGQPREAALPQRSLVRRDWTTSSQGGRSHISTEDPKVANTLGTCIEKRMRPNNLVLEETISYDLIGTILFIDYAKYLSECMQANNRANRETAAN